MASLSLSSIVAPTRSLLPRIQVALPYWRAALSSSSSPAFTLPLPVSTPSSPSSLSSLLASFLELWMPRILLAVPKKKTSHSRKSMRSANKGLKDKTNINSCPACGQPKLAHNICPACYSDLSRAFKAQARTVKEGAAPPLS